jgi:N-glycosylase/DNA lyase
MTPQFILRDLISHLLQTMERDPSIAPKFSRLPNNVDVWRSLLFCILSSQVRISAAARATRVILAEVPFFETNITSSEVYEKTKRILARKDVGHRFPQVRSQQIANSWFAFAQVKDELYDYLDSFGTETAAREAVTQLFPGLGFKQASMFLRDIGYSDRLCIIDTHLLWYCCHMGANHRGTLTRQKYLEIESYLLRQSDELGVPPNIFDSAIWVAVTTFKAWKCMMQFA